MAITSSLAQYIKATTEKKTFSRSTVVTAIIKADPAIVWKLLTGASDYPRWNSTVVSIDGNIAEGEQIKLISTLDAKRTFKLKIKEMYPQKRLVWGDGQGIRIYTLVNNGDGALTFSMNEKIGGFMFPLYSKHIPPFDRSFEQFTADLKKEAEAIQNLKK
ncbi:SRPBCC domain-containing protein [Flavipsychrobacter stenotrophus]|uniref:SRPBCC domain-containing protein n=1 Tax=Flavipsychrobacter stenotrophus TaxID=2077091 RepID=A0A2S7SZT7_9BACT|nr:SRPBCC domain-containing protein [Flavipsychrobacter stenotrophus]PQJ12460.1 SRPBCC domain-containing protein [Flavipsychrobacter stenotrophus]